MSVFGRRRGMGDAGELDDPARDASAARWQQVIKSPAQAKAALGFVAEELHIAYEAIRASDADWKVREEMRQILDVTNTYARRLYDAVETYESAGIDFSDVAGDVGAMIGQLYYDTDRQLQLANKIAAFYEWGWADAFWQAVGEMPQLGADAIKLITKTAREAVDEAIGWPTWFVPAVAIVGVLGVGAWAYFNFLAPAGQARRALAAVGV